MTERGRQTIAVGTWSRAPILGSFPCETFEDPWPGWWPGIVGFGRPLDPSRYRLVGVDFLGAPGGEAPAGPHTTTDKEVEQIGHAIDGFLRTRSSTARNTG
jgi:hypothetical protein